MASDLPARQEQAGSSPALDGVTRVVEVRTDSKVVRVRATRLIAGMQHQQPALDRTVLDDPAGAMRTKVATVVGQDPVAVAVGEPDEQPARRRRASRGELVELDAESVGVDVVDANRL